MASDEEEPLKAKKAKPASLLKLFRYAKLEDNLLITVGIICSIIQGAAYPLVFYQSCLIIQSMADSIQKDGTADKDAFYDQTVEVVYAMIVSGVVAFICAYAAAFALSLVSIRQANEFRKAYFHCLLEKYQEWFDRRNVHEVPIQLSLDTSKIEKATGDKLLLFVTTFSSIVTGLVLAFIASAQLTLLGLLQIPLVMGGMFIVGYAAIKTVTKLQEAYTTAGGIVDETMNDIKSISSANLQDYCVEKYVNALLPTERVQRKMGMLIGLGWGMVLMAWLTSSALLFWQGTIMYEEETENWFDGSSLKASEIILCIFVIGFSCQSIGFLIPGLGGIADGRVACQRVLEVINEEEPTSVVPTTPRSSQTKPELEGAIEFKNVCFSYPTKPDCQILNNMTFSIAKHEHVAFVGETGCGKSTILNLLERIYDTYEGQILIDGHDLQSIDRSYFRTHISLISQEPILFNTSILENIRYGRLDAQTDQIYHAAKQANAHDFIMDLPDQYGTIVGTKGDKLSGGQKQRIAIARAFLRNPKIMMLDEATSSLDKKNQREIMQTFWENSVGHTMIIVAQRLSTIKTADKIFVLQHGTVVESGTHQYLLQLNGAYREMVAVQESQQEPPTPSIEDQSPSIKNYVPKDTLEIYETIETHLQETEADEESMAKGKKKAKNSDNASIFLRVLKLSKNQACMITFAIVFAAIAGSVLPTFGFLMAEQVSTMITEIDGDKMKEDCAQYSLFMFLLSFVMLVTFGATGFFQSTAGAAFTSKLRKKSFKSLLYQDMEYYDRSNKTNLALALANDTERAHKLIGPLFILVVMILFALLVGFVIGLNHNWRVSCVVMALVPFFAYGLIKRQALNLKGFSNQIYEGNISNDCLMNLRTVRTYGLESYLEDLYIQQHLDAQAASRRDLHTNGLLYGLSYFLMYMVFGTALWFSAWDVKENDADISETNASLFTGILCAFSINVAQTFAPEVSEAKQAAKRLFEIIDHRPAIDAQKEVPEEAPEIKGGFAFLDVSFTYPERDVSVLKNVSFKIEPGQFFSFTGKSGSGKSTILQLMLRLYDVTDGLITLDGRALRTFNVKSLRSQIVYVAQEAILFTGTIRENLTLGQDIDDEVVLAAVEKATAADFVEEYGLDSNVGTDGSLFSGGQKQRLSIARAMLRNASVMLLDESTSALDNFHEFEVMNAFRALTPEVTIISIAHRLSSLNCSDFIVVINQGRIIEMGEPANLLKKKRGYFYKHLANSLNVMGTN